MRTSVPDEVAVIGADNDEHLCDLAIPPLTSIDINAEKIGYTAAAMLDQLMQGRTLPIMRQTMAPRGVVNRLSTDTVASDDEEVNRAIRFIREQACNGLRVTGVLAYMGISRAFPSAADEKSHRPHNPSRNRTCPAQPRQRASPQP